MSILSKATSLFQAKTQPSRKATAGETAAKPKQQDKSTIAKKIELMPLMTEKGMRLQAQAQTAVFQVRREATKQEIAQAILAEYGVKPLSIRTVYMRGKIRRRAKSQGFTSDWKKAYVKVKDVQKLQIAP